MLVNLLVDLSYVFLDQGSVIKKVFRNWSVRIGASVLAFMVLVALAAPLLGTVDPSLFDAGSRDLLPGKAGDITTLEGETLQHTFIMGSDSFGRDIYSASSTAPGSR